MSRDQHNAGNDFRQIHGGAAAVQSLTKKEAFTGLAAQEQHQVEADLEVEGRAAMVEELTVRLHVCARLYWNAISSVAEKAQQGDEESLAKFDSYVKRFGWLASAALRAWEQHRRESATDTALVDAAIESIQETRDHAKQG